VCRFKGMNVVKKGYRDWLRSRGPSILNISMLLGILRRQLASSRHDPVHARKLEIVVNTSTNSGVTE